MAFAPMLYRTAQSPHPVANEYDYEFADNTFVMSETGLTLSCSRSYFSVSADPDLRRKIGRNLY
jgi:hypothetical protein